MQEKKNRVDLVVKAIRLLVVSFIAWSLSPQPGEILANGISFQHPRPQAQKGHSASNQHLTSIPFELSGNLVFIRARINDFEPLRFLLDTGSEVSLITPEQVKALGLSLQGRSATGVPSNYDFVKDIVLDIGGLKITNATFVALSLDSLQLGAGERIDGILAGDLFNQFVVDINYAARVVNFHAPNTFQYHGRGVTLPIKVEHNSPWVAVTVMQAGSEAVEGKFLVDTGAGASIYLDQPFVAIHKFLMPPKALEASGVSVEGEAREHIGRLKQIGLSKFVINNSLARFSQNSTGEQAGAGYAGTVGGGILRRFRIIFDYSRQQIILAPNAHFTEPDEMTMSGLGIVSTGSDSNKFVVSSIYEKTRLQVRLVYKWEISSLLLMASLLRSTHRIN
jgi:Aspartyl protease